MLERWAETVDYIQDGWVVATRIGGDTQQVVLVDERIKPTDPRIYDDDVRTRFNFRCHRCGLSITARRQRLEPILDTLIRAGVSAISLSALAARVESSTGY